MTRFTAFMGGLRDWLDWLPPPVASAAVLLMAAAGAALAGRVLVNLFLRFPGKRGAFVRALAKEVRGPLRIFLVVMAVGATLPVAEVPDRITNDIAHALLVVFVLLMGWIASMAMRISAAAYLNRFKTAEADDTHARKHITQVGILRRAMDLMIFIVTISAALMTFEPVRQYGLSLFASAGAASLIVGLAARPLLTNLIAGVQIAVTQPIRLEDLVIVEGEWAWIEEITSTYVVARLWDWRRMILPIAYFLEKPFQNWTHQSASLIGAVFLLVDYSAPIEIMREKLQEIVRASPLWDGQVVALQVSDSSAADMQLRLLASARNGPQSWDLRCEIREKMIRFLQREHPDALPRHRVAMAPAPELHGVQPYTKAPDAPSVMPAPSEALSEPLLKRA